VLAEYSGRVRLILKDFPLALHTLARGAHEAARCAGAQGHYWAYHDRLYVAQPKFERNHLVQYATDVGLDAATFTRCLDEHRFAAAVEADVAQGRALGVQSTPSFFVNGRPLIGAHPVETFRSMIDEALRTTR